jgi:hypothetical protein
LPVCGIAQQPVTWTTKSVVLESEVASWARMSQLSDGSWLAAYTVFTKPSRIRVKRSTDNMRTWQFVTEIVESGRDLDNASLCVRSDHTVLMVLRSVIVGDSYWIETYQSGDGGQSFQYQSQVDWDHRQGGVYEPYLYSMDDGRLLCFYTSEIHQHETPAYSQTLSEKVSLDGGNTWGPEILAIAQPGRARPGEANIVPLPGGVLALFYEMCGNENCIGHVSYSTDGVNWPGFGRSLPSTFQNVQAVGLDNGLIFATSNLKNVIMSPDYGNTWVDTRQRPFAYGVWPAIYRTGVNEIAIVMGDAGENGGPGAYIQFGTVDPSASQAVSNLSTCRPPSLTRPQNCH